MDNEQCRKGGLRAAFFVWSEGGRGDGAAEGEARDGLRAGLKTKNRPGVGRLGL